MTTTRRTIRCNNNWSDFSMVCEVATECCLPGIIIRVYTIRVVGGQRQTYDGIRGLLHENLMIVNRVTNNDTMFSFFFSLSFKNKDFEFSVPLPFKKKHRPHKKYSRRSPLCCICIIYFYIYIIHYYLRHATFLII